MRGTHLIMFDVDGTLVDSLRAEATYYPRACERALGVEAVSSDWEGYAHPTDSGILRDVVARHFSREATPEDAHDVETVFLSLLEEAYAADPGLCQPVPGAPAAFEFAADMPGTAVSVATAGWRRTALFKLDFAGFDLNGIEMASAHDGISKQEIMSESLARAKARLDVGRFDSIVYLGDSERDARAAAALGFGFIGIDTYGFVRDRPLTFPDFSDPDRVFEAVRRFQREAGSPSDERRGQSWRVR